MPGKYWRHYYGDKMENIAKEIKKKITENERKIYNLKPMFALISTGIICILLCIIGFFYMDEKLYANLILVCFGFGYTITGLWCFIIHRKCLRINAILENQLDGEPIKLLEP